MQPNDVNAEHGEDERRRRRSSGMAQAATIACTNGVLSSRPPPFRPRPAARAGARCGIFAVGLLTAIGLPRPRR